VSYRGRTPPPHPPSLTAYPQSGRQSGGLRRSLSMSPPSGLSGLPPILGLPSSAS